MLVWNKLTWNAPPRQWLGTPPLPELPAPAPQQEIQKDLSVGEKVLIASLLLGVASLAFQIYTWGHPQ